MDASKQIPMSTTQSPEYLSAISSKGEYGAFTTLGSVAGHLNGEVHSKIFDVFPDLDIASYTAKDAWELPVTDDREGYHGDRHFDWWLSGLFDLLKVERIAKKYNIPLDTPDTAVFEIGCASGRFIRHVLAQTRAEVWCSDINLRHVEWVRKFLSSRAKIFQNTILPMLPMEDRSIDLACAFSVFTHIDDLELQWLAEIRRTMKPGGIAYITIHSENTWAAMTPELQIYKALLSVAPHVNDFQISPEFLSGPMPREKTVFAWDTAKNYNTNVFFSTEYIRREWGRYFEVVEIIPAASDYQDVVVLRKP